MNIHFEPNETCMKMNFIMNFIARFVHDHILPLFQFTVHVSPVSIVVKMSARTPTRTRRDLTLFEKNELLKKYDALEKMSQTATAGKLGISQSVPVSYTHLTLPTIYSV